jgi:hypothetical protein
MNKRQLKKKLKQEAVPEFTVQQAWDKLAEYLASRKETVCYFVDSSYGGSPPLTLHNASKSFTIKQGGNFHPGGEL